ncbi:MAG: C4-dicarboxylate ABC transporter, partial [Actinomycetota bacterium]
GLWWSLFAIGDLLRVRRSGGVPFHPGWWGFVFPIAALELSLIELGTQMDSAVIEGAGLVGFAILILVWAYVAVRTCAAVLRSRTPA